MTLQSALFLLLSSLLLVACKPSAQSSIDDELAATMTAPYDYYMNNMRTTRFTADGQVAYRLNASRITHYPEGDHAVLENPDLFWSGEGKAPWQLSASSGDLHKAASSDEDELLLEGDVLLTSESADGKPIRIATETLTVLTLSRMATTASAVSLATPGASSQAVGMELRLEDNHIKLLNEVRGSYEP